MSESNPSPRCSIYHSLGAGSVADVLMWKKQYVAVLVLISATTFWFLFERAGYNLLSFAANVLLLLVVILFFWAKSASLLNRPLPPLPDLRISDDSIVKVADELRVLINYALSIAREITVYRNFKLFLKVSLILCVAAIIGSLFNFLTLIYVGVLVSMSIPMLYDKYQDHVDDKLSMIRKILRMQYRKFDDSILKKMPSTLNKEKKLQ